MSKSPPEAATAGDLTCDEFLGGRLRIQQPRRGFRAGSTAVLLAAAVPALPGQSVLELGCGVGTALLCVGRRVPDLRLTGLELQTGYADLARQNAAANRIVAHILEGDVTAPPAELRAQNFDHVLMNPPFFDAAASSAPRDTGRDLAHREAGSLAAFLDQGIRRLVPGGTLTLIYPAARLAEVLSVLDSRVGGICILPIAARPGDAADRMIVSARKGRRAPLALLAPFLTHDGPELSDAAESVLRDMAPIAMMASRPSR